MSRSYEERIADKEKQLAQLQSKIQELKAKESQARKKAHMKQIIELGTIFESVIGEDNNTPELRSVMVDYFTRPYSRKDGSITSNSEIIVFGLKKLLDEKKNSK